MVIEKNKLGYDVQGYEYQTGYAVEEIIGSQFDKQRMEVLYPVTCSGYSDETDCTDESEEKFDDKKLLR
jgi:hypothetical protein